MRKLPYPEKIEKDLIELSWEGDNGLWQRAIWDYFDEGKSDLLVDILQRKLIPPPQVFSTLAHIASGAPRGIGTRHVSWQAAINRIMKYEKIKLINRDVRRRLKKGEITKLKGVSINQMVADEFNRKHSKNMGRITEAIVANRNFIRL